MNDKYQSDATTGTAAALPAMLFVQLPEWIEHDEYNRVTAELSQVDQVLFVKQGRAVSVAWIPHVCGACGAHRDASSLGLPDVQPFVDKINAILAEPRAHQYGIGEELSRPIAALFFDFDARLVTDLSSAEPNPLGDATSHQPSHAQPAGASEPHPCLLSLSDEVAAESGRSQAVRLRDGEGE